MYQGRCRTPDSIKSIVVLWSLLLLIPGTKCSFTSARIFLRVSSTSEFTLVLWNCFKIFTHFSRESSFAFLAGWVDEACSRSGCEKSHLDLPCPPGSIVLLKRPPGQKGGKTCYFTTVSQYQCTEYTVIRGKCEITEASQSVVSHSRKQGLENGDCTEHSKVGPNNSAVVPETERWQSTRLIRTRAQPNGGETIVRILNGMLAARLAKYSYQLTEQILRSAAQQLLHSRLAFMSSSSRSLLSWAPMQQQRSRPPAFTAGVKHPCVVSVLC